MSDPERVLSDVDLLHNYKKINDVYILLIKNIVLFYIICRNEVLLTVKYRARGDLEYIAGED